ncbi:MAG: phosphoribosyltransferase family protein [Acidobacteriota bacterium]
MAEALRARGLATLLIDLVSEGEREADRLDGQLEYDVERLADRLLSVAEWVRRDSHLGHLPIAYFGGETGAAAALIAAARRPELVRAVVSCSGRPDLAGAELPRVTAPALMVVGGADERALELNTEAIDRMRVPTQLAIVPGASAQFEEPGALDEVAQLAGEWIVEHIARELSEPQVAASSARPFRDRRAAGTRLAELLHHHHGDHTVVCGLPRGGVVVADELAKALGAALDVWLVRKIGLPFHPELGMGAIAEGAAIVLDPAILRWSGASPRDVLSIVHRRAAEVRRRARGYRGDHAPHDLHGKTAILVDEGIATPGVLRAAVAGARRRGAARVVIAAPVAAGEAVAQLRLAADELVAVKVPHHLVSLAGWYEDLRRVDDREVIALLDAARRRMEPLPHRSAG